MPLVVEEMELWPQPPLPFLFPSLPLPPPLPPLWCLLSLLSPPSLLTLRLGTTEVSLGNAAGIVTSERCHVAASPRRGGSGKLGLSQQSQRCPEL